MPKIAAPFVQLAVHLRKTPAVHQAMGADRQGPLPRGLVLAARSISVSVDVVRPPDGAFRQLSRGWIQRGEVVGNCFRVPIASDIIVGIELECPGVDQRRVRLWLLDLFAKVMAWLVQLPLLQVHPSPTYVSWLNQVERWFAISTQRAIREPAFPAS